MYCLATIHFVTDRRTDSQTDRRQYNADSQSCYLQQYDRLKTRQYNGVKLV